MIRSIHRYNKLIIILYFDDLEFSAHVNFATKQCKAMV